MKTIYLLTLLGLSATLNAQTPTDAFRQKQKTASADPTLAQRLNAEEMPVPAQNRRAGRVVPGGLSLQPLRLRVVRDTATDLPIFIENTRKQPLNPARKTGARLNAKAAITTTFAYLNDVKELLKISDPATSFAVSKTETDDLGQTHVRLNQVYRGLPVHGSELIAHLTDGDVTTLNGRTRPITAGLSITPKMTQAQATERAFRDVGTESIVRKFGENILNIKPADGKLCVFGTATGEDRLAYQLTICPNFIERWEYMIDAQTGAVLDKYNNTCGVDGPVKATAKDLNGVSRTIQTYLAGQTYYLLDASRAMFSKTTSKMPNGPIGALWTIDFRNDTSQTAYQTTSANNTNWTPTAVSAHANASIAYEYFLNTFQRNALDGKGGTMISIINVADPDDAKGFDNAVWTGKAMVYGNGRTSFKPLAGGLDVAGHEMTHGVTQNTAALEYKYQSGAINESMSDVFGVLIDRANWTLGEEVVLPAAYPSGALRSMSNPNQNGSSVRGYQPKTMAQYITTTQDNGGVHINSGIPNYAFYLFATDNAVGRDKAEKVYYRTLTTYLTRTSQFVDLRLAVLKATADLYGATGAEYAAAKKAFDAVGITDGQGTPTRQPDLPTATGQDKILLSDTNGKDELYSDVFQTNKFEKKSALGLRQRPSVTDDGQTAYYVTSDKRIRSVNLTGTAKETLISNETVWANVAVSKDNTRLAFLTDAREPTIYVYSAAKNKMVKFKLYNPTTGQGVTNGDVLYADSFEWDYTGEYIIYDAYNKLTSATGDDISYWDVGIIRAWDKQKNDFGDGTIDKLFNGLKEGESIGNPSFSKNSPDILAFDYVSSDGATETYSIIAANLSTGKATNIYKNNTLGYPNYNRLDNKLAFNTGSSAGKEQVGGVDLTADKVSAATGKMTVLYTNAKWPVWYTQSVRAQPAKTAQAVTFAPLADRYTDQPTFTLSATSSANLPVVFSMQGGPARIAGSQVTVTGPGKVTIRAAQDGNTQFLAATPVDQSFNVLAVLGLEPTWADALNVYPNPATAVLTIEIPKQELITEASLTNLNGVSAKRIIPSTSVSSVQFDVRNLPRGVYTVTIKTESGSVNRQVVKE